MSQVVGVNARFDSPQQSDNCEAVAADSLGSELLVSASYSQPQVAVAPRPFPPLRFGGYAAELQRGRNSLFAPVPGVTADSLKARHPHPRLNAFTASQLPYLVINGHLGASPYRSLARRRLIFLLQIFLPSFQRQRKRSLDTLTH